MNTFRTTVHKSTNSRYSMKTFEFQHPGHREISSIKTETLPGLLSFWKLKFGASVVLGACSLVFLLCPSARAQSYAIDWFTIDGGGGTSTGGVYSVNGTIGQPDANQTPMTGGNYSLVGGIWSLFAVQTPGAPVLSILLTSTNTAMVYWPSPSTDYVLQQNTNSVASVNWSNVTTTPTDNGSLKFIIVNPPSGNRFYRLFKP